MLHDVLVIIYNNPENSFVAGFIGQMNFVNAEVKENKFFIEEIEFTLPKEFNKKELLVGIRAEKMINGDKTISVKTDIVEMSGAEKIVYFSLNGSKCSAKVPLNYQCEESIELKLAIENMYFFDKESGKNLLI